MAGNDRTNKEVLRDIEQKLILFRNDFNHYTEAQAQKNQDQDKKIKAARDLAEKNDRALRGNGDGPGIKARVDKVDQAYINLNRSAWAVGIGLVGNLILSVFK